MQLTRNDEHIAIKCTIREAKKKSQKRANGVQSAVEIHTIPTTVTSWQRMQTRHLREEAKRKRRTKLVGRKWL